jgi:hypothetical protein
MFNKDFDPLHALEQLNLNQQQLDINLQNIVRATNDNLKSIKNHQDRLDLNQTTINQMLESMQNQYKLIMAVFEEVTKLQAVNNNNKGNGLNDETSNNNQSG